MKYFLDTEFIERFHKPLFGKARHVIDLISIGIVAEDGREYYAVSNEYNYNDADKWVQENVIDKMYIKHISGDARNNWNSNNFQKFIGKSNSQIIKDIMSFVNPILKETPLHDKSWNNHLNKFNVVAAENRPIEFYGYYADYDWVLFCSLFGTMMDLPNGFPMYCRDLKQMLDELTEKTNQIEINYLFYNSDYTLMDEKSDNSTKDISDWSFDQKLTFVKSHKAYPKQSNEHNALSDAKWNFELYTFIQGF